jgi:succinate-semialdehyde dehydrogenase/glutarate-semialdehyde dehydrogenase
MELGGNAPFIVFADADLDAAVAGAVASKYRNAGQTCVCANRILVEDEIYDTFAERLASSAQAFKLGDGHDEAVTMGPLIHQGAAEKVVDLVDDALAEGALVRQGCGISDLGSGYVEPGVLIDVTPQMRIAQEENFGPVAPLLRFHTEAQAIQQANATQAGLAAYFYTTNAARMVRVAEALEYGIVGINEGIVSNEMAPFGGVKESGNGREGSRYGLDDYLEIKYLCIGGIKPD